MAQMPTEQVALALAALRALRTECADAQLALDAFVMQTSGLSDEILDAFVVQTEQVVRAAAGAAVIDPGGLKRTGAANYSNVKLADQPEERDYTLEQCAAPSQQVTGGMLPCADLAVVGPCGRFRQWQAGWRAFSTLATRLRLAAEDVNRWVEQVTRPAAAGTSRGRRGAPVTVEEQLAARIRPGFETNAATPMRKRRRDDSTASDDFPPAPRKKKHGRTEVRWMWCKKHGKSAGGEVCPMGRAHKCWFCLSPAHTGTEGGCL